MEVMDMSLDKFYKMLYENDKTVPEDILGKIAVAVSASAVTVLRNNNNNYHRFMAIVQVNLL